MGSNLVVTKIQHPEARASGHARTFFRILAGYKAPRNITAGDLNNLIKQYSEADIAKARVKYKGGKRASPYLKAMVHELGGAFLEGLTRDNAELYIKNTKRTSLAQYEAAKRKLRGMTYKTPAEICDENK